MICFVCTENANQTLAIFRDGEINSKIAVIIEKHLRLKPQLMEKQEEALEICNQCWEKLRDFNEFFEYVAKVHKDQTKYLPEQLLEDTGGELDEKHTWEPHIKTETLEETLDDNVELHFFETDDVFTENPLLELTPEDDDGMEELINNETRNNEKQKNTKTRRSKKISKRPKTPEVSADDEDNEQSLASLLDDIKHEDSDELYDANNELKESPEKKKKTKRTSLPRTEAKRTKKAADKTNEPKRRKGHVLLEENDGLIKKHIKMLCQMCSYIGEDFSNLIKHYKEEHAGVKPFIKCCERKLDCPSDILQHAYFHEDPEHFKCQICGKTFINNSGLKDHFMKHHEPEENLPYGCDECPRRFSRKNLLAHHKAKHIPKTERSHFCEICQPPKAFASEYILQIHIKSRHTKASNICHVCAKEIRDKQAFEKHVRLHFETSGPRIKCPREGCESWLKDEDNLKQHLRRFHNQAKFECPECGRICKNKHSLTCHLRNTHSTQIFTCEECQKNFKSALSLKEHMAGHTGEPLYSCPFCTRTFNSKANMYSHKKKAHPVEWDLVNKSKMGFI
ncbi:transcription factor grauzone-like [Lucilia sericata]|uniref:transcription factor grauzone-like n=1 Tax=Lucilia sericata TaxID=13632 RepID=UPI0018A80DA9|nr:transcription factor grauzone-like [Lucilia sericata]